MRTTAHDESIRRAVVRGALIALTTGGLLWGARLLASGAPDTIVPLAAVDAAPVAVPKATVATAPPLPTIVQPSATRSPTPHTAVEQAAVDKAAAATAAPMQAAAAADLAPRLRKHLSCLAPGTQHDAALDAVAAEQARQDNTPLP